MLQELTVDLQNFLVVAEQITYLTNGTTISGSNTANPSRCLATFDFRKADILRTVTYHRAIRTSMVNKPTHQRQSAATRVPWYC